jgi:deazaflavin-dependent oxidoreductase (nitroreductase family)
LFWQIIELGPRLAYAVGLGPLIGRSLLLLTTIGRKTGRRRTVPLTYQERDGIYLVASARGPAADWLKNAQVNPNVEIRVGRHRLAGRAEVITDVTRSAEYLRSQMERNPRLFQRMLRAEGSSKDSGLSGLEELASRRPMLEIRPRYPKTV